MLTSSVTRTVPAPIEKVYDWLVDPANYKGAVPGVTSGRFTGDKRYFRLGIVPIAEDVTYAERPLGFDYTIRVGLPPLVKHGGNSARLRPVAGGTEVTWTSRLTVSLPGGDLLVRPVMMGLELGIAELIKGAAKALR